MVIAIPKLGKPTWEAIGQYRSYTRPINSWNASSPEESAPSSSQRSLKNKRDSGLDAAAVIKACNAHRGWIPEESQNRCILCGLVIALRHGLG